MYDHNNSENNVWKRKKIQQTHSNTQAKKKVLSLKFTKATKNWKIFASHVLRWTWNREKKHKRGACEYKKSHFIWLTLCVLFLLTRACDVTGKNAFSLFCFRKRGLAIVIFCVKYVEQKTNFFQRNVFRARHYKKDCSVFIFLMLLLRFVFEVFKEETRALVKTNWRQRHHHINVTITLKLFSTVFVVILPSFVILSEFFLLKHNVICTLL